MKQRGTAVDQHMAAKVPIRQYSAEERKKWVARSSQVTIATAAKELAEEDGLEVEQAFAKITYWRKMSPDLALLPLYLGQRGGGARQKESGKGVVTDSCGTNEQVKKVVKPKQPSNHPLKHKQNGCEQIGGEQSKQVSEQQEVVNEGKDLGVAGEGDGAANGPMGGGRPSKPAPREQHELWWARLAEEIGNRAAAAKLAEETGIAPDKAFNRLRHWKTVHATSCEDMSMDDGQDDCKTGPCSEAGPFPSEGEEHGEDKDRKAWWLERREVVGGPAVAKEMAAEEGIPVKHAYAKLRYWARMNKAQGKDAAAGTEEASAEQVWVRRSNLVGGKVAAGELAQTEDIPIAKAYSKIRMWRRKHLHVVRERTLDVSHKDGPVEAGGRGCCGAGGQRMSQAEYEGWWASRAEAAGMKAAAEELAKKDGMGFGKAYNKLKYWKRRTKEQPQQDMGGEEHKPSQEVVCTALAILDAWREASEKARVNAVKAAREVARRAAISAARRAGANNAAQAEVGLAPIRQYSAEDRKKWVVRSSQVAVAIAARELAEQDGLELKEATAKIVYWRKKSPDVAMKGPARVAWLKARREHIRELKSDGRVWVRRSNAVGVDAAAQEMAVADGLSFKAARYRLRYWRARLHKDVALEVGVPRNRMPYWLRKCSQKGTVLAAEELAKRKNISMQDALRRIESAVRSHQSYVKYQMIQPLLEEQLGQLLVAQSEGLATAVFRVSHAEGLSRTAALRTLHCWASQHEKYRCLEGVMSGQLTRRQEGWARLACKTGWAVAAHKMVDGGKCSHRAAMDYLSKWTNLFLDLGEVSREIRAAVRGLPEEDQADLPPTIHHHCPGGSAPNSSRSMARDKGACGRSDRGGVDPEGLICCSSDVDGVSEGKVGGGKRCHAVLEGGPDGGGKRPRLEHAGGESHKLALGHEHGIIARGRNAEGHNGKSIWDMEYEYAGNGDPRSLVSDKFHVRQWSEEDKQTWAQVAREIGFFDAALEVARAGGLSLAKAQKRLRTWMARCPATAQDVGRMPEVSQEQLRMWLATADCAGKATATEQLATALGIRHKSASLLLEKWRVREVLATLLPADDDGHGWAAIAQKNGRQAASRLFAQRHATSCQAAYWKIGQWSMMHMGKGRPCRDDVWFLPGSRVLGSPISPNATSQQGGGPPDRATTEPPIPFSRTGANLRSLPELEHYEAGDEERRWARRKRKRLGGAGRKQNAFEREPPATFRGREKEWEGIPGVIQCYLAGGGGLDGGADLDGEP